MIGCRNCKESFEPRSWQINKSDYECDDCRKARQCEYRAKRKEIGRPVVSGKMGRDYHRAYEARYFSNERNRQRRNELMRKYAADPELAVRHKARRMVRYEIHSGRMEKMPCEVCGDKKVHAHHDDYSNPLHVRWLCPKHHCEHHAKATGESA